MTVTELINRLSACPGDREVWFQIAWEGEPNLEIVSVEADATAIWPKPELVELGLPRHWERNEDEQESKEGVVMLHAS